MGNNKKKMDSTEASTPSLEDAPEETPKIESIAVKSFGEIHEQNRRYRKTMEVSLFVLWQLIYCGKIRTSLSALMFLIKKNI